MATTDSKELKKQDPEVILEKEVKQQEPKTVDQCTAIIIAEVITMYKMNRGMQDVRRRINTLTNELGENVDKKELSKSLRETFERFKQFAEASHQEVVMVTSQIGW